MHALGVLLCVILDGPSVTLLNDPFCEVTHDKERNVLNVPSSCLGARFCPDSGLLSLPCQALGLEHWGKMLGGVWVLAATLDLLCSAYWMREGSNGVMRNCRWAP